MIKVKLFCCHWGDVLETELNNFLPTVKKLVDIKYASSGKFFEALVIYETEAAE